MNYEFYITVNCNLNCKYCYVHRNIIGYDNRIRLNKIYLRKIRPIDSAEILGGEPLLYPEDVLDLIRKLRDKGVTKISLTTNGTLYNEKIQKIVDSGIDIYVSLDGNEDIHNKNRGMFRETISNLDKLKPKCIHMVITRNNSRYLVDSVKFLSTLGYKISIGIDHSRLNSKWFVYDIYKGLKEILYSMDYSNIVPLCEYDPNNRDSIQSVLEYAMNKLVGNYNWKDVIESA